MKNTFYRCPRCHNASTEERWNEQTRLFYQGDIITLGDSIMEDEDAGFSCPICKKVETSDHLEKVDSEMNNKIAACLLRKTF